MTGYVTAAAGGRIYAADWNTSFAAVASLSVTKPIDTGRASITANVADPHLLIAVPAGRTYTVTAVIVYNGDPAGDLKGGLYLPSGASFSSTYRAQNGSATTTVGSIVTDVQTGSGFGFGCIGTASNQNLTALIVGTLTSGTGGNLGFTWSQVTSSTTATTVKAGSFITLIPN